MIVQIYEIQDPHEAEQVIEAGVDHVGSVILGEDEWKNQAVYDTIRLVEDAPARSSLIPLFNTRDTVFRALDYYQPDIVHFCENLRDIDPESKSFACLIDLQAAIRDRFPAVQIMRSIPIPEPGRVPVFSVWSLAQPFEAVSDFFLTDTVLGGGLSPEAPDIQPVNGFVGITGRICDWGFARELVRKSRIPVILAGGLGPENVAQGIDQVQPSGVDSCSGTNQVDKDGKTIRFVKDYDRVRDFVKIARNTRRG